MIFSFKLPAALLFVALGVSAAPAALSPVHLSKRDVWSPPITTPNKSTVWCIGSEVTATWDTSNAPAEITNPTGTLFLGHLNGDGSGGENLDVDHPLANGFPLSQGKVSFEVPNVKPRNNYIVVLMGDSGNASQKFKIKNCY